MAERPLTFFSGLYRLSTANSILVLRQTLVPACYLNQYAPLPKLLAGREAEV
jgi:hypothetical protein